VIFTAADLEALTASVVEAWRRGADLDWSVPATTTEWTCTATAEHAVDCVLAPALFLASRRTDRYPEGGQWSSSGEPTVDALVEALEMNSRILIGVVATTPPDVRAICWRHPVEVRPPADFLPRGALELVLHAQDVCGGLGLDFAPPTEAVDHLRHHVADWPFFQGYWQPLSLEGDPWEDLLTASGRLP
jgi:hypothetical protein